jgi:hypothetical protein
MQFPSAKLSACVNSDGEREGGGYPGEIY